MKILNAFVRELNFTVKDRTVWLWFAVTLGLAILSLASGVSEVKRQQDTIQRLMAADEKARNDEFKKFKSWGSAAYYSFHLTYDLPSDFAYAALGQRDTQPWKHRIRMLALEGQIYERDVGNPSVALIGRFDFAFFSAFIVPLLLIMLLYDLKTSERTAGRYNLLEATAAQGFLLWFMRALIRAAGVFLCLVVPLVLVGLLFGTSLNTLVLACLWVLAYIVFWMLLCFFVSAWRQSSSVILMALITLWLSTAVIFPSMGRLLIDRVVPIPTGADILMLQRETVNDAWDLPKKATMDAFFERHPEWVDYKPVASSFEWQWYYAFQQVGDQKAESLSSDYQKGRLKRDSIARWVSLLAPPSLLERALQSLAKTDVHASIHYENKVRAYHAALRAFYYPKFFRNEVFDKALLSLLPKFESKL